MNEAGNFFRQMFLGGAVFRMCLHLFIKGVDFFFRKESEIFQVLDDIPVVLVEPELVEFVGRGLFRVEPHGTAGSLAEFRTVCFEHEGDGQTEGFVAFISFSDEFNAVCDIAPLVGAADLQLDAAFFIKHFIVDGLEDLVREFREGNARFQTGGDYVFRQHGIDVEKVKAKAVEKGLLHPGKKLTDVEAFQLVFAPGFSTSDKISNVSGRGVGLDVVKTHIEKLNGTVTVESELNVGTRFIIKLPLTLAIIQGLLVRVGEQVYSIPITSVIESHRVRSEEIRCIDNYEVFNVREEDNSLLRLNRLFGIACNEVDEDGYNYIVVVGTEDKKVGLMVDSLIGEEDVVIKPLKDQFTSSPGIAGASILGDGSVSLIIDVGQLLELGLKQEMQARERREASVW